MIVAMMATGLYLILATVWRRQAKEKMEHLRNGTQTTLAHAGLMIFGMNAQGKKIKPITTLLTKGNHTISFIWHESYHLSAMK